MMLIHNAKNINMNVQIIKSKRKTLSIQVIDSNTIKVRAPYWMTKKEIQGYIDKNEAWIRDKLEKAKADEAVTENIRGLSELELEELARKACEVISKRVEHYAPIVGVTYGKITIRNQKTRWGSCSSKGNLNFNVALMRVPLEILDYVVVHELCHRIYLNHSKDFWNEVGKVLPDYKEREMWLKENGNRVMAETIFERMNK